MCRYPVCCCWNCLFCAVCLTVVAEPTVQPTSLHWGTQTGAVCSGLVHELSTQYIIHILQVASYQLLHCVIFLCVLTVQCATMCGGYCSDIYTKRPGGGGPSSSRLRRARPPSAAPAAGRTAAAAAAAQRGTLTRKAVTQHIFAEVKCFAF